MHIDSSSEEEGTHAAIRSTRGHTNETDFEARIAPLHNIISNAQKLSMTANTEEVKHETIQMTRDCSRFSTRHHSFQLRTFCLYTILEQNGKTMFLLKRKS